MKSLTCPPPHRNLPGWFPAASLQGWSLPTSSVQSWPHPSPATPGGAQRGSLQHICNRSDPTSYCENLNVEQCAHHVEESHHRNNWSRAHVGYESTEEGPAPQVPVVFPKKLLWGLVYKHTHDRLMDNTVVHGSQIKIFWKHRAAPGIPAQVSAPPVWSLSSQNDARFRPPVSAARHLVLRQRRCVHSPQSSLESNKTCLNSSLNEQWQTIQLQLFCL